MGGKFFWFHRLGLCNGRRSAYSLRLARLNQLLFLDSASLTMIIAMMLSLLEESVIVVSSSSALDAKIAARFTVWLLGSVLVKSFFLFCDLGIVSTMLIISSSSVKFCSLSESVASSSESSSFVRGSSGSSSSGTGSLCQFSLF